MSVHWDQVQCCSCRCLKTACHRGLQTERPQRTKTCGLLNFRKSLFEDKHHRAARSGQPYALQVGTRREKKDAARSGAHSGQRYALQVGTRGGPAPGRAQGPASGPAPGPALGSPSAASLRPLRGRGAHRECTPHSLRTSAGWITHAGRRPSRGTGRPSHHRLAACRPAQLGASRPRSGRATRACAPPPGPWR